MKPPRGRRGPGPDAARSPEGGIRGIREAGGWVRDGGVSTIGIRKEMSSPMAHSRLVQVLGLILLVALGLGVLPSLAHAESTKFYDPKELERQIRLLDMTPEGPPDQPWLQRIDPHYVDTAQYKKEPPWTICFSNAGIFNPWRVVGFEVMKATVETIPQIGRFIVTDAENKDEKQIADISDLLAGRQCDLLLVSPNTTEALTPIVERAAKQLPVIVFDRGVNTTAPVTFISPIGGYAYGAQGARFIVQTLPKGGKVLALRISPGVDVLETRWSAAEQIFRQAGINVIGVEFTGDDRSRAKSIVTDYLQRYGQIDAVWMDAGATSVAVLEAFEDMGYGYPIITGEDQQDFLEKWQQEGLIGIAPTYPTFQWRTAIIAATMVLSGQKVPKPWVLPQPTITKDNLAKYYHKGMPPQYYALSSAETLPGFPQRWGGKP